MSDTVRPHRQQPTRLPHPWDSPGKNTGVGCHFLLQCRKVKSESEVAQSCPTLATPWTAAHQAPLSMGFSRQEFWSGLPLPSPSVSLRHCFSYLCNCPFNIASSSQAVTSPAKPHSQKIHTLPLSNKKLIPIAIIIIMIIINICGLT